MTSNSLAWTADAAALQGPAFERFQVELAIYNGRELEPRFPDETWREELDEYAQVARAEGEYIEAVRREIRPLLLDIPIDVDGFIEWFEELKHTGPGQGDPLFPWLAEGATHGSFDLFYLIQNPGSSDAQVTVRYLRPAPLAPLVDSRREPGALAGRGRRGRGPA